MVDHAQGWQGLQAPDSARSQPGPCSVLAGCDSDVIGVGQCRISSRATALHASVGTTASHESSRALLSALGFSAKRTVDGDFAQCGLKEGELSIIKLGDE